METSGSDSELERESGLDQASGSTSAIPTTNSDTSTASSLLDRLRCPHPSDLARKNNLRIIGSFLKDNRLKFWESRNRIMGEILSIISQSLIMYTVISGPLECRLIISFIYMHRGNVVMRLLIMYNQAHDIHAHT